MRTGLGATGPPGLEGCETVATGFHRSMALYAPRVGGCTSHERRYRRASPSSHAGL